MKHKMMRYASLMLIVTSLLFLNSCQKDDESIIDPSQQSIDYKGAKLKRVDVEDIFTLNNFVSKNVSGNKIENSKSQSVLQTVFGEVSLEDIMQVTDLEGHINYTLTIKPDQGNINSFYNLVIHQYPDDKEPTEAFVYEYKMTPEFSYAYSMGEKDLKQFSGTVYKYVLSDFEFAKSQSKGSSDCGDGGGPDLTPCEIDTVDGGSGTDDGDISNPLGDTSDGSSGSDGGGGTNTGDSTGNPTDSNPGDGATEENCITTTTVVCCDNGFCDPHIARIKGKDVNGEPIYCSGSSLLTLVDCYNSRSSSGSKAGDCGGGGTIGIDEEPFLGGGFENSSTLQNTLGLARIKYLDADCLRVNTLRFYWNNLEQTVERAKLMGDLADFWQATGGPTAPYTSVLANSIMRAESDQKITTDEARYLFRQMALNGYSEQTQNTSNFVVNVLKNDNFNGSFDSNFYSSINTYLDLNTTDPTFPARWVQAVSYTYLQHPNASDAEILFRAYWNVLIDDIQTLLDVGGLVPIVGEPADLINGGIYFLRGDNLNAGLSVASAVPFAGWAATGTKYIVKVTFNEAGEKVFKIITNTTQGVTQMASRLAPFVQKIDNAIDRIRRGAIYALEGTGTYRAVGGHHPLAKKAFEGDIAYIWKEAFSVPSSKLNSYTGLNNTHSLITGRQNSLYSAWKNANPNTTMNIEDMANIELQAMVDVGIPEDVARGWVVTALEDIKLQGVSEIKNIPWNGVNPN